MMILIPIYDPLIKTLGFDAVWFWMQFLIIMVAGAITPPFGYIIFALKAAVPEISLTELYPPGRQVTVSAGAMGSILEGVSRPGHFDGVTTIVTKLLAIAGECSAYFGRKDAQQLAVVRRMAADLDLPVRVVGCPIVREPDGVAMSSRNAYLSSEDRDRASRVGFQAYLVKPADPADLVEAVQAQVHSASR